MLYYGTEVHKVIQDVSDDADAPHVHLSAVVPALHHLRRYTNTITQSSTLGRNKRRSMQLNGLYLLNFLIIIFTL